MRKRLAWLAALCAALIAAGCLSGWAGASQQQIPTFYQLSVNDQLPMFSPSVTPLEVSGVIYVPYTVFDKNVTEVDLGVYASESRTGTQYIVTLYSLTGLLEFDLNANTCRDRSGESQDMRAIIRSSRVYVPASAVCSYFGLNYSLTPTEYGTLVRITNGSEELKGDKFRISAAGLMRIRYEAYVQSLTPAASPSPAPTPVPVPTPARPTASPVPSPGPDEPDKRNVRVYLAFRCGDGEGLDGILNTLDRNGVQALFFFRAEDLPANADMVRRMAGSGHLVGLYTEASGGETARADLEAGSRLLEEIARLRPHAVLADNGGESLIAALTDQGWRCWRTNTDGVPSEGDSRAGLAYAVLQTVALKRSEARVLMDGSALSAGALSRILSGLREDGYDLRFPAETEW